jgi:hypothetical protein
VRSVADQALKGAEDGRTAGQFNDTSLMCGPSDITKIRDSLLQRPIIKSDYFILSSSSSFLYTCLAPSVSTTAHPSLHQQNLNLPK